MKTVEGYKIRPLGREFILTAENATQVNFNKMISLNESAAYLWQSVDGKDFTVDTLVNLLLEKYEIDEATARTDSAAIIQKWIEAGIAAE